MTSDQEDPFELAVQQVGLVGSKDVMGGQIIITLPSGSLRTTILSVSNANDDGFVELAVAPVYVRGDLVTHVVCTGVDECYIRTTYWVAGEWKKELTPCSAIFL